MELILIAAVAENGIIGNEGRLPWNIPEDLQRFRQLTSGHPIIMGRKTYESIGRPLPQRRNLVLSRSSNFHPVGVEVFPSLEAALSVVASEDIVYVIGGQQIYEAALPLAHGLELTEVHQSVVGDAFFPQFDKQQWREVQRDARRGYSFVTYRRVP